MHHRPGHFASHLTLSGLALTAAAAVVAVSVMAGAVVVPAAASSAATYTASPFSGRTLYVDPYSPAARDAAALRPTDPSAAAALEKIASRSQADWFGDWNPLATLRSAVSARVATVRAAGAYPVLVAYDIPMRDCGSYSGGGASSASAYRAWIRELAAGIGSGPAVVILEPDALAQLGCLAPADQQVRLDLLKFAVKTLSSAGSGSAGSGSAGSAGVTVYLDAGHSGWVPPAVMADRLSKAGIAGARGFALNTSSFGTTAGEVAYAYQVAPRVGWKRAVIDTSRNGNGPASGIAEPWCNPPGRALGVAPTAATGDRLIDAFLWVKHPGESDGTCRGGPPAGSWWRSYAVDLAAASG